MTEKEIDEKVREHYKRLIAKRRGYVPGNLSEENAEVVNKCLDYYFQLKAEQTNQDKQLNLF